MTLKCRWALAKYRFSSWRMRISAVIILMILANSWIFAISIIDLRGKFLMCLISGITPLLAYLTVREFDKRHAPSIDRIIKEHNNRG